MKLESLKIVAREDDVVIFNPATSAWYYTSKEGLDLLKRFDGHNLPSDQEEREFLDEAYSILFKTDQSVSNIPPFGVSLHVTTNCNMGCGHCRYSSKVNGETVDLTIAKAFIDEAMARGAIGFSVTGGEPLTQWKTTRSILEYIRTRKSDAPISLLTNGSLVTKDRARVLSDFRILVQVSLDSLRPRIFQQFRNYPLANVLAGIRNLLNARVETDASIVPMKINRKELFRIIRFCGDEGIGVHFPFLEKGGRGSKNWEKLALSDEELIGFLKMLIQKYFRWGWRKKMKLTDVESVMEKIIHPFSSLSCRCGRQTAALYPDGKVYFCTNLVGDERFCVGCVKSGILMDMPDLPAVLALPETSQVLECHNCEVNWLCSAGCKDRTNLFYGDMLHPDPWCKVLRWWFTEMLFITANLLENGES